MTALEDKLQNYQRYYNKSRAHSGRGGVTPVESDSTGLPMEIVYAP